MSFWRLWNLKLSLKTPSFPGRKTEQAFVNQGELKCPGWHWGPFLTYRAKREWVSAGSAHSSPLWSQQAFQAEEDDDLMGTPGAPASSTALATLPLISCAATVLLSVYSDSHGGTIQLPLLRTPRQEGQAAPSPRASLSAGTALLRMQGLNPTACWV